MSEPGVDERLERFRLACDELDHQLFMVKSRSTQLILHRLSVAAVGLTWAVGAALIGVVTAQGLGYVEAAVVLGLLGLFLLPLGTVVRNMGAVRKRRDESMDRLRSASALVSRMEDEWGASFPDVRDAARKQLSQALEVQPRKK